MKHGFFVVPLALVVCVASCRPAGSGVVWSGAGIAGGAGAGATGTAAADCSVGSTDLSPRLEVNVVQSDFEIAYLVDPADYNCCDTGYRPESITFRLNLGPEDMLYLPVQVAVQAAEPGANGYLPGGEICATPMGWFINGDVEGTVTVPPYPTGGGDLVCPCLDSGSPYFLVARIIGTIEAGAEPDAVRDGTPVGGKTFVRWGGDVWQDVVNDLGWTGELIVTSDVVCCDEPTVDETSSWGTLKAIYH